MISAAFALNLIFLSNVFEHEIAMETIRGLEYVTRQTISLEMDGRYNRSRILSSRAP